MRIHDSETRKINSEKGGYLVDGSPNYDERIEIEPTRSAMRECVEVGLKVPDLPKMRTIRHDRLVEALVQREYGGFLLTNPLNIRHSTDSTKLRLWNTHNLFRAVLVCAHGYKTHRLEAKYQKQKYSCSMHGVGLCVEWPLIAYDDEFVEGRLTRCLWQEWVKCVEALVSRGGGYFFIKLEDQVFITEIGHENRTQYLFDPKLVGIN